MAGLTRRIQELYLGRNDCGWYLKEGYSMQNYKEKLYRKGTEALMQHYCKGFAERLLNYRIWNKIQELKEKCNTALTVLIDRVAEDGQKYWNSFDETVEGIHAWVAELIRKEMHRWTSGSQVGAQHLRSLLMFWIEWLAYWYKRLGHEHGVQSAIMRHRGFAALISKFNAIVNLNINEQDRAKIRVHPDYMTLVGDENDEIPRDVSDINEFLQSIEEKQKEKKTNAGEEANDDQADNVAPQIDFSEFNGYDRKTINPRIYEKPELDPTELSQDNNEEIKKCADALVPALRRRALKELRIIQLHTESKNFLIWSGYWSLPRKQYDDFLGYLSNPDQQEYVESVVNAWAQQFDSALEKTNLLMTKFGIFASKRIENPGYMNTVTKVKEAVMQNYGVESVFDKDTQKTVMDGVSDDLGTKAMEEAYAIYIEVAFPLNNF